MTEKLKEELSELQYDLSNMAWGLKLNIELEMPDLTELDWLDEVPFELEELKEKLDEAFEYFWAFQALVEDHKDKDE